MTSARTSGTISGAAQGAATGSMFGPWGTAAGAVVGGIGGLISGSSADSQFSNQMAWANYNRQSQYNTDIYNINSSLMLAGMNAGMAMKAASYNASNVLAAATYNAKMIGATTAYNIELLDNELTRVWQDLDLDITQIEMFRARERGGMLADQSASGTVMGQDSNADVIMAQQTQEAMDVTVVEFNADREAANINNQMAQGRWEGEVAIQQTMWEGQVQANSIMYNSKVQSAGTIMGAVIQADANMYNAKQNYMTSGYNIEQAKFNFQGQNTADMISGLFQAGSTAVAGAYARKIPGASGSAYSGPLSKTYQYNTPKLLAKPSSLSIAAPKSIYGTTLSTGGALTSGL